MLKFIKNHFFIIIIFFTLLYLIISPLLGIYIPCVFKETTGLYCPGCGVTRMLMSILKLDLYQAFRYNPLLFCFLPFILFLISNIIYCKYKKKESIYNKIPEYIWYILLFITILFWILRNIIPYLAPTMV